MDCSTAKYYSSDWDSYPCPQGHLPHALTNWAISPHLANGVKYNNDNYEEDDDDDDDDDDVDDDEDDNDNYNNINNNTIN